MVGILLRQHLQYYLVVECIFLIIWEIKHVTFTVKLSPIQCSAMANILTVYSRCVVWTVSSFIKFYAMKSLLSKFIFSSSYCTVLHISYVLLAVFWSAEVIFNCAGCLTHVLHRKGGQSLDICWCFLVRLTQN